MQIDRLDHLVLTVADVAKTCDVYARVLGMEVVTFATDRKALPSATKRSTFIILAKKSIPKPSD